MGRTSLRVLSQTACSIISGEAGTSLDGLRRLNGEDGGMGRNRADRQGTRSTSSAVRAVVVSCSATICLDALHCRRRTFGGPAVLCRSHCPARQGLVNWLAHVCALGSPADALTVTGVLLDMRHAGVQCMVTSTCSSRRAKQKALCSLWAGAAIVPNLISWYAGTWERTQRGRCQCTSSTQCTKHQQHHQSAKLINGCHDRQKQLSRCSTKTRSEAEI